MSQYNLYPEIQPFKEFYLQVSDIHNIHVEQVGNPDGKPVVFLHGGPGAGIDPIYRQYFDPEFYHVILIDQRGSGKSKPHAELEQNSTWEIVEDLEKVRKHLGIDKWLVFGGSWGSTLGMAYATKHSDNITGLILRGIFPGRKQDIDWFYNSGGASKIFPDAWEHFLEPIQENKRDDLISAYYDLLRSDKKDERLSAARSWSIWEASTFKLIQSQNILDAFGEEELALALARLECHFFINNFWFETDNYLLENARKYKHLPIRIVHGRYDVICPVDCAFLLKKECPDAELAIVPDSGHSMLEEGITAELVRATEEFKSINWE